MHPLAPVLPARRPLARARPVRPSWQRCAGSATGGWGKLLQMRTMGDGLYGLPTCAVYFCSQACGKRVRPRCAEAEACGQSMWPKRAATACAVSLSVRPGRAINARRQGVRPECAAKVCDRCQSVRPKGAAKVCSQSVRPTCAAKVCGRRVRPKRAAKACGPGVRPKVCGQSVRPKRAVKVCGRGIRPRCAADASCRSSYSAYTTYAASSPAVDAALILSATAGESTGSPPPPATPALALVASPAFAKQRLPGARQLARRDLGVCERAQVLAYLYCPRRRGIR
eukprot:6198538-Pleurochrysis_carterae.AAC.2